MCCSVFVICAGIGFTLVHRDVLDSVLGLSLGLWIQREGGVSEPSAWDLSYWFFGNEMSTKHRGEAESGL